jgi:hypothetical protein
MMGTQKKFKTGLKKTFIIIPSLVLLVLITLLVFIYFFLKSPSFVNLVENILEGRLEKKVEIGSISFKRLSGIIVRDFILMDDEKENPLLILPHTEIDYRLYGLLARVIDNVSIREPKIFLTIEKRRVPEAGAKKPSLPFSLKKTSIQGGKIHVQLEKDRAIPLGPVNLTLFQGPGTKARVKGDVFVPRFNSTVSLEAGLDMARLDIERGHIDFGLIELGTLSTEKLALLHGRKIKGSLSLTVDILRQKKEGLGIEFKGNFHDLEVSGYDMVPSSGNGSGQLMALLTVPADFSFVDVNAEVSVNIPSSGKGAFAKTVLKGTYEVKEKEFKIDNASLSSPHLGSLAVGGSLKDFSSDYITYAIDLRADDVSLSNLDGLVLKPLGIGLEGFRYGGMLDGTIRVNGSFANIINWRSDFELRNLLIRSETLTINLKDKPVGFASRGAYNSKFDRLTLEFLKARLTGLKPWTLKGSLTKVTSGNPELDLIAEGGELPRG